MDRDTAVTRIQDGLGFSRTLASTIILRLQEEQRELERGKTLPPFLTLEDQPLTLAATSNSVNLPTNFLRRHALLPRYTPANSTISQTIPWKEFDAAYEALGSANNGAPQVAVLRKSTIYFLPTSDRAYTITWTYYQKDDVLTSNIENLWLANAPELLIGGAGLRIAKDKRDKDAIAYFGDMYKQARITWLAESIVEEDDGPLLLGANA